MEKLKNLLSKLEKKDLERLISDYYCDDGVIGYLGDRCWRNCIDSFLDSGSYDREVNIDTKFISWEYDYGKNIEGTLHIDCYSTTINIEKRSYSCVVLFKPKDREELVSIIKKSSGEYSYIDNNGQVVKVDCGLELLEELEKNTREDGYIIIEEDYPLKKEKERDKLFKYLFPDVKEYHDWLVYSRMESIDDPFEDKEIRDVLLNKLCIALIEEYNTEENAIKFIKESI